jgi:asparagine synthase (glutamine-hydrolysing)
MTLVLAHRGPDGRGHWYGEGVALGHLRLAILDLSPRGAQPMHYAGRYVVTYNGEIYNYRELRQELEEAGYRFESQTDTEVIMAAYDRWGTQCLQRFNGMWAFALLDRREQRMFIARDRFGVKPLYFARIAGAFVFASEVKALLRHPDVRREPDLDYCRRYLVYGPREYDGPTAWRGIERLENGHFVEASLEALATGRVEPRRFWTLQPADDPERHDPRRAAAHAEQYHDLLTSAVRLRLRSDVKVGSALSGGLDSSSIVWLINRELQAAGAGEMQEAFSCVYRTPGTEYCDESVHINRVAGALGVNSNQIEPVAADVPAAHRAMIYYLDNPPESTLMSSWHTFLRVSRTEVVVTLDGQGADEQLAGYPRYIVPFLAHSRAALSEGRALLRMPGTAPFVRLGVASRIARGAGMGWLTPMVLRWARKQIFDGSTLNVSLAQDSLGGLQNLIHYADRTSMAFSIESRMPFLDFRLAEFLTKLPASYKIHDGWTKHVARLAFDGRLPGDVVWRRDKMGWPIPEAFWFGGELRSWYRREIESSPFLRELGLAPDVERSLAQGVPINRLTRLLNLATWHRVHVERQWRPERMPSERVARRAA